MNSFKKFFLNHSVRKAVKNSAHINRKTVSYNEAKSIGVLFNAQSQQEIEVVNKFISTLQKGGKKVNTLTYFKKKEVEEHDFSFEYFTDENVDVFGKVQSEVVDDFVGRDFDYLFYIATSDEAPYDFVLANSKAKCRVGRKVEDKAELFELMLGVEEADNLRIVVGTIQKYVEQIKTK